MRPPHPATRGAGAHNGEITLKIQSVVRIAVVWNDTVVSEQIINPRKTVSLGSGTKAAVSIPAPASSIFGDRFDLFKPAGSGLDLQLDASMEGWVESNKDRKTLTKNSEITPLSIGDRGLIKLTDQTAIFFSVIEAPKGKFKLPLLMSIESRFLTSLLFALMLHISLLVSAFMLKDYSLNAVNVKIDDRFIDVMTEIIPEDPLEEAEEEEEEEDVGKQAGGEEGKFGEEDKLDKSKVPTTDGELVDKIKNVGLAKALSSSLMGSGALSSVFGNRDGFSDQLNAAMSGGDGELQIGHGAGGMGMRGIGGGGGGSGFGRIHGMGKVDTGGGRGTRARLGKSGKRKKKFKMSKGRPSVGNYCKQADILRVVNSRQRAITYCYEKELARNPELSGKVTLVWNIGLDGKVMKVWVGSSSLKNGQVESCMTRSVKRWKFTKPDGGICQIRFPFVFNSGL
jgi:hypothetical protein